MLQNIDPPAIAGVGAHVIGNHVDEQTHSQLANLGCECVEIIHGTEVWIDLIKTADVVPVSAFGTGEEDGRGIDIRNADVAEIRQKFARLLKGKTLVELKTIGGQRNAHDSVRLHGRIVKRELRCLNK